MGALTQVSIADNTTASTPVSAPTGAGISFYTPAQVAELLQVSEDTVLRRFARYPGVIDLGSPEDVRRRKRKRSILRIPHDILHRFLKQHCITR